MPDACRVIRVDVASYPYPRPEEILVSLQAASIIHSARESALELSCE